MGIFSTILENELRKRNLSIREAAKEIGISHTTLIAAKEGTRITDTKTALKIAQWVGIPLSTIIEDGNPPEIEKSRTVQAVSLILEAAPELEQVFCEAADELINGDLSIGDFHEIVEYAAFKIQKRRAEALKNGKRKTPGQDQRNLGRSPR